MFDYEYYFLSKIIIFINNLRRKLINNTWESLQVYMQQHLYYFFSLVNPEAQLYPPHLLLKPSWHLLLWFSYQKYPLPLLLQVL
jgi:hypothetical protein